MEREEAITLVNKRLGVIIALLLRSVPDDGVTRSLRDQIQLLSELGLRPRDIAEILGRTQTYVNKELASLRKAKTRKK
jgi:hypothetical protein